MKNTLMLAGTMGLWLQASTSPAQLGQNAGGQLNQQRGANFLPRANSGIPGNQQFSPFGNAHFNAMSAFNSYNNGAGFNYWNNIYGPLNPYYSSVNNWPYATPWVGNPFGPGAYNNTFAGQNFYGNNLYGAAPPFGGNMAYGYGNFAPIVGVNNGWWPYQPAFNPYNPVNQALTNMFLQGLPNLNGLPGNAVLPRGP